MNALSRMSYVKAMRRRKMNNFEIAVTTIVVLVFIGVLTWIYTEDA